MLRWFHALMPKEERFFDLFARHSDAVLAGAQALRDLITSMDNSIDQMQKTAKSVMLFDLNEFTPQMREMADAIVKCAELVREAVPLLHSISAEAGHISDLTAQISALEGRAD